MEYEEILPISIKEANEEFASGNPEQISRALLGLALYQQDWRMVQDLCLKFIQESNSKLIKNSAITCLGHLARIHGNLDTGKVVAVFDKLQDDPKVKGKIQDVLDDIDIFICKVQPEE